MTACAPLGAPGITSSTFCPVTLVGALGMVIALSALVSTKRKCSAEIPESSSWAESVSTTPGPVCPCKVIGVVVAGTSRLSMTGPPSALPLLLAQAPRTSAGRRFQCERNFA